jgi:cell division protease FtsH
VALISATNFPENIDPAIKRSGRLDRTIEIKLPDAEVLAQIFRFHLGSDVLAGVDLMPAALNAVGYTGADVEAWVRRAKGRARRQKRDVSLDDLIHEIRSGREALPDTLRRVCALHEAGHLIAGVVLNVFEPQALSILDDGGATRAELSFENSQTEQGIENFITSMLSGRAAEEVILGPSKATAGAGAGDSSDFARATAAPMDLELRFGFGLLGVVHFSERSRDLLMQNASIVAVIKDRLDRSLSRARELIDFNRGAVEAVARRLMEAGYLDRSAIRELLQAHPLTAGPASMAADGKDR